MANSHLVSGLLAKRAEMLGLLEFHHKEMIKLGADLTHLDATVKLLAPDTDLRGQRPKLYRAHPSPFKNGDVPVMIMDVMRKASAPLSTKEIAEAVMRLKGASAEGKSYDEFVKPIHRALHRMKSRSLVASVGHLPEQGSPMIWQLV